MGAYEFNGDWTIGTNSLNNAIPRKSFKLQCIHKFWNVSSILFLKGKFGKGVDFLLKKNLIFEKKKF